MDIQYYNLEKKNLSIDHESILIFDEKILNTIKNLRCLQIINDKKLLYKTIEVIKNFSNLKNKIIIFGTGGSNLGARALNNISLNRNIDIEFFDNIDPLVFENSFKNIDYNNTGFIIVSKSGETPETLSQFGVLIEKAEQEKKLNTFFQNTLVVTEYKNSTLYNAAKNNNILTLEHDKDIGGRYSIFSNVGIAPAIIAGLDIEQLYLGAKEVLENIDKYIDINIGKFLYSSNNSNYNSSIIMTYSDSLYFFGKWYLQLWSESLGKENKGITPIHSVGTTDQHSQLQLYLDGPKDKFFTFITSDHFGKGLKINNKFFDNTSADYLKNKSMGDLMFAEQKATIETFKRNKFKFRQIHLPLINELSIGKLLTLSIIETIATCTYMDVNPFNQPAVEQGKILTKEYLR